MSFPLPSELIVLVFIKLDVPSLLRCMQVCKQFYSIIQESSALLYKVELFSAQMETVEPCSWEPRRCLDAIRTHTEAWNKLKFPQYGEIRMEEGQSWDLVRGILAQAKAEGGISCVQLPNRVKGIPEQRWDAGTGFQVRDFTMDISQDLLVAIELRVVDHTCCIHLRSCTTGHVHPKATSPVITPTFLNVIVGLQFLIRVCGSYVAILFTDASDLTIANFAIWNWRSGVLQMHAQGWEFCSFTFLSDELVLVAFIDDSGEQISLRVLRNIPNGDSVLPMKDVPYLCDMRYPRLREQLMNVLILSEPSPTGTVPANLAVPFTQSSTDVLFTVAIRYFMAEDITDPAVMHFLHRSIILSHVQHVSGRSDKALEWESWGPAGTRMLKLDPSDIWLCYSYGTRFICTSVYSHRLASIYDFNPYVFKKAVGTASRHPLPWKAMEKETRLYQPFEMEIVTFLPGCEASLEIPPIGGGWEAAMITEDHIVLVESELQMYAYMAM